MQMLLNICNESSLKTFLSLLKERQVKDNIILHEFRNINLTFLLLHMPGIRVHPPLVGYQRLTIDTEQIPSLKKRQCLSLRVQEPKITSTVLNKPERTS